MRIDKFLKVSRILKRRSLGKEACDSSRVIVNGKPAKPSFRLSVGDVVEIVFGAGTLKFKSFAFKLLTYFFRYSIIVKCYNVIIGPFCAFF